LKLEPENSGLSPSAGATLEERDEVAEVLRGHGLFEGVGHEGFRDDLESDDLVAGNDLLKTLGLAEGDGGQGFGGEESGEDSAVAGLASVLGEVGGDFLARDEDVEEEGFAGLIADVEEVGAHGDAFAVESVAGRTELAEGGAAQVGVGGEGEGGSGGEEGGLTFGRRDRLEEGLGLGLKVGIDDAEELVALAGRQLVAMDGAGREGGDDVGKVGGTGEQGGQDRRLVRGRKGLPVAWREKRGGDVRVGWHGGAPGRHRQQIRGCGGPEDLIERSAGRGGFELAGESGTGQAQGGE